MLNQLIKICIHFIAKGSVLGSLNSESDIKSLKGSIKTEGRIVLSETGIIEGEVSCKTAIIEENLRLALHHKTCLHLSQLQNLLVKLLLASLLLSQAVFRQV